MQQAHGADHKYSSSRARVRGLSFSWCSNLGTETKKQSIFTSSYRNGVQGEMGLGQGGVQREGGRKPGGGVVLRVNLSSRGGIHCGIHY